MENASNGLDFHIDYRGYEIICEELARGGVNSFVAYKLGDKERPVTRASSPETCMKILDFLIDQEGWD
jgi:hypothetical protein